MNKVELISAISEKAGLTKIDSEKAIEAFVDTVVSAVSAGDKVQMVGFGVFEKSHHKEKMGHNPQTGKEMKIPATDVPHFKPGKLFKAAVK